MYKNVVAEISPDRNGQTEMSRDRNGPDRNRSDPIGPDQNGQTESAKLKSPVPIMCSPPASGKMQKA